MQVSSVAFCSIRRKPNEMEDNIMYYVKIKDITGHEITIEVSFDIFQLFEEERKEIERERYERRNHLDKRGLEDYILGNEATSLSESAEDQFFRQETFRTIRNSMRTCTPNQQKRFAYYLSGYSFAEIARMEGRTQRTIKKSINAVIKKVKKICDMGTD